EPRHVSSRVHLPLAEFNRVLPVGYLFPDGLVRRERVAALVDVAERDGLADANVAAVGLLLISDHAKERRLAGAVRADDADDAARRQGEAHFLDEDIVAVSLGHVVGFDDDVAQARSRRDVNLKLAAATLALLRE